MVILMVNTEHIVLDRVGGTAEPTGREARLVLFGRALMEKLASPRKSITAHVYRVLSGENSITSMDVWLMPTMVLMTETECSK